MQLYNIIIKYIGNTQYCNSFFKKKNLKQIQRDRVQKADCLIFKERKIIKITS